MSKDKKDRQPTPQEIKQWTEEAKKVACECAGTTDFGMTSKIQLAFVIRNLVIDFHQKKAIREQLEQRIESLETDLKVKNRTIELMKKGE